MNLVKRIIDKPEDILEFLMYHDLLNWLPDRAYLKLRYRVRMKKKLNLKHPQTFNEKLQWLKLHDRNPEYIKMVDKYEVKQYVAKKIGKQYIIPNYGIWDSFDEIDFNSLPDQFVLKCTHDSGGIVICPDKKNLDMDAAREKLNKCLKHNYYWVGREWPYKYVKPRIIAEKYMSDGNNNVLNDYKFMCFNGEVMCSFTCTDRFSNDGLKVTFYDRNWKRLPFKRHYEVSETDIKQPEQYEKMIQYSEILSQKIPFVRTDFYEIKGQLYFGELTFYPGDGMEEFIPEKWDYELGSWLELPEGGGYTLNKDNICLWIHPIIDEKKDNSLKDYKLFCFCGVPIFTLVCSDRFSERGPKETFYDNEWKRLSIKRSLHDIDTNEIEKPHNFELMQKFASVLSQDTPFLRIDFFETYDKLYFGELTFYPASGFEGFEPDEWDYNFGNMLKIGNA